MAVTRLLIAIAIAAAAGAASLDHGERREAEATPPAYDFSQVTSLIQNAVTTEPLDGASLILVKDGHVVYEQYFGSYNSSTLVPIASATKWVSASVFMSLVDDGVIGLDDSVSMYLPEWTGQMGTITMRQLWSHTSGLLDDHPCLDNYSVTIADCVEQIRLGGLVAAPGSQFYYGGASMQVAGRVAEVATGQTWQQLFFEQIRLPLGMTNAYYNLGPNPRIGGGVNSTLGDYARLLQMHADGGVHGQSQVLSLASVQEMQKDQTFGVPIAYSPHPFGSRYGLGIWRDIVGAAGEPIQLSSQGKFAFSPWLDNQRGYFGVFLVEDDFVNLYGLVLQVQQAIRVELDTHDTDGDGGQDSVDVDDDGDGLSDAFERACGTASADADTIVSERIGAPFAGVDDDGDGEVDEWLPATSGAHDCDGDGYTGNREAHVFAGTTLRDQDSCGTSDWPADFIGGAFSGNKVDTQDLASYIAPIRHLNSDVGANPGNVRWDVLPGPGVLAYDINVQDMAGLVTVVPPMLGGPRAFNGPACPWP